MVIRVVLPSTVEITISWWQSRFTSTPNRERQGLETAGSALIWILACAQRVRGDVSACWYKKSRCGSNGPNVWFLSVKNRHLLNTWLICRNLTNHKKSTVYLVHPSCEKFKIDRCGSIIRRGWNSKNKVFHAFPAFFRQGEVFQISKLRPSLICHHWLPSILDLIASQRFRSFNLAGHIVNIIHSVIFQYKRQHSVRLHGGNRHNQRGMYIGQKRFPRRHEDEIVC